MIDKPFDLEELFRNLSWDIPANVDDSERTDFIFMQHALVEAVNAFLLDEVPVGCVIVHEGKIIASAKNSRELTNDPTGHAEIIAVKHAAKVLNSWRLENCVAYVTLEPCIMCIGTFLQARVKRIVYGAKDQKAGAVGTLYNLHDDERLNHRIDVKSGVLADASAYLLREFFKLKRPNNNKYNTSMPDNPNPNN
ncbi:MAG: tRNA adenosine(34) deaminase TadA [Planctomycetes bacterium]|nr:tRNA adenosine(34) deaminase TadA [Planctomycetota bacterium]